MICSGWHPHLVDLAYGELDPRDLARTQAHVDQCPGCRQEVEGLRFMASIHLDPVLAVAPTQRSVHLAWAGSGLLALSSLTVLVPGGWFPNQSSLLTIMLLLAWTGLYAWVLGCLDSTPSRDPRGIAAGGVGPSLLISFRGVAYGLLTAILVSLGVLWTLILMSQMTHHIPYCLIGFGVSSLVLMVAAASVHVVGLGLGFTLRDSSRVTILCVLVLYLAIMGPALGQIFPMMSKMVGLGEVIGLLSLWGLSGAYLGNFLSGIEFGLDRAPAN